MVVTLAAHLFSPLNRSRRSKRSSQFLFPYEPAALPLFEKLIVRHIFLTGHGGHEVLFCLRDRLSANVFGTNHRVHSSDDRPRAGNIAGGVVAPRLWKTELA